MGVVTGENTVRGREQFEAYKKYLNILVRIYRLFPLKQRIKIFEHCRYVHGKLGLGIRYACLKSIAKKCGDNVAVFQGTYILNPQNLIVGDNVSIQPMCYLECGHTEVGIRIDDDVSIGHGTTIMATSHDYEQSLGNIKDHAILSKPVCICRNVWIGAKAIILGNVTVHEGCVVGAGAVVTKDTEENGVYAGVPARCVKKRKVYL